MALISKADLLQLAETHDGKCVSIYLPTHRAGRDVEQDPIRLKTLLDEAERQLQEAGFSGGDTRELLDPLREQFVNDPSFWQHQLDGLAIFRTSDMIHGYRLPFSFEELVVLAERFHVKPLLPLLSGNGRYYVLALQQDSVRVFEGTKYGLNDLQIEDLPEEQSDLLLDQDRQRNLQWHTATQAPGGHPRAGARPAAFHGHGGAEQQDEDEILHYFRRIDQVLAPALRDDTAPLLLAGEDKTIALYRRANNYSQIVEDEAIRINPHALRHEFPVEAEALHRQAWDILEPRFEAIQQKIAGDYLMWAGKDSERASSDIKSIVPSAYFERVRVLFVATDREQWGTFDPDTGEVHLDDEPTPDNRDLLDLAAVHTLLNNGLVYAVTADQVPGGGDLAAVYRY